MRTRMYGVWKGAARAVPYPDMPTIDHPNSTTDTGRLLAKLFLCNFIRSISCIVSAVR